MGSFTITHWIVVAIVILILFGRGKISETMGDFGKGFRSFKKGLAEEDGTQATPPPPQPAAPPAQIAPPPSAAAEQAAPAPAASDPAKPE